MASTFDHNVDLPHTDRVLRFASAVSLLPAFILCIVHGVVDNQVIPALGLIPMVPSAILGVVCIARAPKSYRFRLFIEVFLAAFLLAILIATWVMMGTNRHWYMHQGALAAYATMPLMLNFIIHVFFIVRDINVIGVLTTLFNTPTCPHCQRELRSKDLSYRHEAGQSYLPVHTQEVGYADRPSTSKEPRESTDDESATLV